MANEHIKVLLLFFRPQLSKSESQETGNYVCWMVVCCRALLGEWQNILRYMDVRVVPLSSLCVAHTDIYRWIHWLCPRRLLLRCNGVSTASPSVNLLALLVVWMGSSLHSVEGDSNRRLPVRERCQREGDCLGFGLLLMTLPCAWANADKAMETFSRGTVWDTHQQAMLPQIQLISWREPC